jgi:hypothetical protein
MLTQVPNIQNATYLEALYVMIKFLSRRPFAISLCKVCHIVLNYGVSLCYEYLE